MSLVLLVQPCVPSSRSESKQPTFSDGCAQCEVPKWRRAAQLYYSYQDVLWKYTSEPRVVLTISIDLAQYQFHSRNESRLNYFLTRTSPDYNELSWVQHCPSLSWVWVQGCVVLKLNSQNFNYDRFFWVGRTAVPVWRKVRGRMPKKKSVELYHFHGVSSSAQACRNVSGKTHRSTWKILELVSEFWKINCA